MTTMTVEQIAEEMFAIFNDKSLDAGNARDEALYVLEKRARADRKVMNEAFKVAINRLGDKGLRDFAIMKASEAFEVDPDRLN
jgi:hypothetical protein